MHQIFQELDDISTYNNYKFIEGDINNIDLIRQFLKILK